MPCKCPAIHVSNSRYGKILCVDYQRPELGGGRRGGEGGGGGGEGAWPLNFKAP